MYIGNEDTSKTTLIACVGPYNGSAYIAAQIRFSDDFDLSVLPSSLRAHRLMTIRFSSVRGNEKNEGGMKRLKRILKVLEAYQTKIIMPYKNSITLEQLFEIACLTILFKLFLT